MNVLLTETCVRSCPYCFAKQYMSEADMKDSLTWDNLIYIADFLEGSNEHHISLLGGEPLLHPYLAEFIMYLHERGFNITIFTSGIMSDAKFDTFSHKLLSYNTNLNVSFVCNVNDPNSSKKSELDKVYRFFQVFGDKCSLSYNIYHLDFEMEFLTDYIVKYGLGRHIRLGLAHPIPNATNIYINPSDFSIVKDKLLNYFENASQLGIVPGFDCGFPLCMFNETELGKIYKYTMGQLSFQCGPAIDVGTDLSCWSCFPLSNFNKKSLYDFNSYRELYEFYESKMNEVRNEVNGIYIECDTCNNKKYKLCSGGCLAHILNNFQHEGGLRHDWNK